MYRSYPLFSINLLPGMWYKNKIIFCRLYANSRLLRFIWVWPIIIDENVQSMRGHSIPTEKYLVWSRLESLFPVDSAGVKPHHISSCDEQRSDGWYLMLLPKQFPDFWHLISKCLWMLERAGLGWSHLGLPYT